MRRANVIFGVASAAVAVALLALVAGGSHRAPSTLEPTREEPDQAPATTPNAAADAPAAVVSLPNDDQNRAVTEAPAETHGINDPRLPPPPDENTMREWARRDATRDIQNAYSLLLEDLGLAPQEKDALVALLIDIQIAAMFIATPTTYQRGTTIPEQERLEKIAAIIGDPKLQEFLALERHVRQYSEVGHIASLLRRKAVPLTDAQRHGVLKILVDVYSQYEMPPSDLDRYSLAFLERTLTQIDEYDRHVIELIPSVVSATQDAYVFEVYQRMAYQRADALEEQKRRSAANPTEKVSWYFPGRWPD